MLIFKSRKESLIVRTLETNEYVMFIFYNHMLTQKAQKVEVTMRLNSKGNACMMS